MLFSIMIPVYNVEKYLEECIKSILDQTEQDFEVILINDGSTDNSADICDFYAQKFPDKFFALHQENKGALLARRAGVKRAKGDFCLFIDSDDYIDLNTLKIIKETIQKFNCDMVMFNYLKIYSDGSKIQNKFPFFNEEVFELEGKKKIYEIIANESILNNLAMKAAKRSIIDVDSDYSKFACVKNGEDLLQLLPIVTNANKIVYIDKILYYYRKNASSITMNFRGDEHLALFPVFEERHKYLTYWDLGKDSRARLYARDLYNCIWLVKRINSSGRDFDKNQIMNYIREIADSKFFADTYKYANHNLVEFKDRIIVWLLHRRYIKPIFFTVRLTGFIEKTKKRH